MANYTFNSSIPAANHSPSSDQPDMLTNNQSTNDLIAVDHTTFNVNNGGQHKQITFNQDASYVPVGTVNPPVLFTNTVAPSSVPQLFFYSGTTAQASSQYINSSTGSTFMLGGMIIRWGFVTYNAGGGGTAQTYTLSPVLPNSLLSIVISPKNYNGSNTWASQLVGSGSGSQFTIRSLSNNIDYYYTAIGY